MYLSQAFKIEDHARLVEFIHANSFATVLSQYVGSPVASHLPVLLHPRDDNGGIRFGQNQPGAVTA